VVAGLLLAAAALLASGPARAEPKGGSRRFDFTRDTFAYTNDLYWTYDAAPHDVAAGPPHGASRDPHAPVEFGQRCITVVRTARQFFLAARFSAEGEVLGEADYRARVRAVLAFDPRDTEPAAEPIVFPGFADLRSFSRAYEPLLKEEQGGRAASYLQRGNWRMILPFWRRHRRATADTLLDRLAHGVLPIVRVVNFPVIDVNHALLVFGADAGADEIRFRAYDPNDADHPVSLLFDRANDRFALPRTAYFAGGSVNVYEIFDGPFF
jgi:hypothetical protein